MIALAGAERLALGLVDGLDFEARARWPLDAEATPALGGAARAPRREFEQRTDLGAPSEHAR